MSKHKSRALDEEAHEEEAAEIEEQISSPGRWSQGLVLLLGTLGLQRLATFAPEWIERFYSRAFYPSISRVVSAVNIPFTFSLAEITLVTLVVIVGLWLLWLFLKVLNGLLSPLRLIVYLLHRAMWIGGAVMLLFLLLWGFNYQRLPLATNLNLHGRETRPGELESICGLMISRLNASYEAARVKQDLSEEKAQPLNRQQMLDALEKSYQGMDYLIGSAASRNGYGPPKALKLSSLLTSFGISGIYSPFTGEANYNDNAPACDLPFVIAHEKAHQRGFAREDEANFIGFLACINAPEPYVRYSGYLLAMPRVMSVLRTTNETEYNALLARLGQGAMKDLQTRAAFWHAREDRVLSAVARQANNTYLRANRVRSGIANYDEVTALVINYFLTYPNGGRERLLVADDKAVPANTPASTPRPVAPTPKPTPVSTQAERNGFIP